MSGNLPVKFSWVGPVLVALAIYGTVGARPAAAEATTIDDVLSSYVKGSFVEKRKIIKQIGNLGLGMERANRVLESQRRTRLFCPPSEPVLTGGHYFDIVKRKVQFNPDIGSLLEEETATVLINALMKMYPCSP